MAVGYVIGTSAGAGATVREPIQKGKLFYNGQMQTPTWIGLGAEDGVEVVNTVLPQRNAGTYYMTVKPAKLKKWSDGTKGEKRIPWKILPLQIKNPYIYEKELTYDPNKPYGESDAPPVVYDPQISACNDDIDDVFDIAYSSDDIRSVGNYTMSWKLRTNNYQWQQIVPEIKSDSWSIKAYPVEVPIVTDVKFTYSATNMYFPTITPGSSSYWTIVSEDNGSTSYESNAGKYSVNIKLNNSNYVWRDGDTNLMKKFSWVIEALKITKPSVSSSTAFTYDGTEHNIVISNAPSTVYASSAGTKKSINTGNFSIIYSLSQNTSSNTNTVWNDGTTADCQFDWKINPLVISQPVAENDTLLYNGTEQLPNVIPDLTDYLQYLDIKHYLKTSTSSLTDIQKGLNSTNVDHSTTYYLTEISVKQSTNSAGIINVKFDQISNYGTTKAVSTGANTITQIKWFIEPIRINMPYLTQTSFTFNNTTVYISNYERNFNSTYIRRSGDISKNSYGDYTVTYSLIGNSTDYKNVLWSNDTSADINIEWSIAKYVAPVPTVKSSLIYNGQQQSPTFDNFVEPLVTKGGTYVGTDVNTYNATFTVKYPESTVFDNEDQTTQVTVPWTIDQRLLLKPTLSLYEIPYAFTGPNEADTIYIQDYFQNYDSDYESYAGQSYNENIGKYTVTISLKKNTATQVNTVWNDNTITTVSIPWEIYDSSIRYFTTQEWETIIKDNTHYNTSRIDWGYVFEDGPVNNAMLSAQQIKDTMK